MSQTAKTAQQARNSGGQVWDLEEIRAWADQSGRAVHELPESWPMAAEAGSQAPRPGRYRRG